MKKTFRELKPFTASIIMVVISVLGGVWGNLNLPNYLSRIINIGIVNADFAYILKTGGVMLLFTAVAVACNIVTGYFAARTASGLGRNIRSKVFTKVQGFSQSEFDTFSTASLITRTNNDIVQVQNFMNMFLRVIINSPVMCIGGIVMAYSKSPAMSAVLLFSMPALLVAVGLIARKAMPLSQSIQTKLDRVNLVMREKLTGIRVIRAFGTEDFEKKRFELANRDLTQTTIKMQRVMTLLMPVLMLLLNFTTIAIVWRGGQGVPDGTVLIGDVITVAQYVMQIMMSVMMLSMIFVMYPRAAASSQRIFEILDTEASVKDIAAPKDSKEKKGYLTFQNVSFSFPNAEEPAVMDVSFEAKPGETTAIIGSTGSGKTALINLIPRFYDVQQGEILVDGINVKEYDQAVLRKKIGYVPQKALLFRGTVEDNIRYGDSDATDERVVEALKIAQAYDFVRAKDLGLQSKIAQGGANVSGGQRQRLAIARAVVRKPEIYIFDDSFSALDFKTDAALREALSKETQDATVLIVAQRVSTIMNATRILVLEDGKVMGMGTHQELMQSCPTYGEIVRSQLSEEEIG